MPVLQAIEQMLGLKQLADPDGFSIGNAPVDAGLPLAAPLSASSCLHLCASVSVKLVVAPITCSVRLSS